MKLQPHGRPLVISALPANNVRLKLYFFEQRGDIEDERGVRFIARTHFTPTIDIWIFAGRGIKPSRVQPTLQLILDSLHPLETDEIFRGHIVEAVRIRCVTYEEACELRDILCPFVYICPSALQITFYEKIVPISPVRVEYDRKKRYDRTLPMSPELEELCRSALDLAQGTSLKAF